MNPLCACGCGNPVRLPENNFIHGHATRKQYVVPTVLCACGCGGFAPISNTTRRGNIKGQQQKYIHGHNRRKDRVVTEKECPVCGKMKQAVDFYADQSKPGGLSWDCKECTKARVVQGYRQEPITYHNRAKIWRKNNPARQRFLSLRYDTRKKGVFDEDVDPQVVYDRDGGCCQICGLAVDRAAFHVDHIVPLSKGGRHNYGNVQLAHPSCNHRKHARLPTD